MSHLSLDLERALAARLKSGSEVELPARLAAVFGLDADAFHLSIEDGQQAIPGFRSVRRLATSPEDQIRPGFAYASAPEADGLTLIVCEASRPDAPLGYMSLALEAEPDRLHPRGEGSPVWLNLTVQAIFVAADRRGEGLGNALAAAGCSVSLDLVKRAAAKAGLQISEIRSEVTGLALAPASDRLMRKMEDWLDRSIEISVPEPAFI